MHPDEGILPLTVFKISPAEHAWFADRLGRFDNFYRDPVGSKRRLAKICNAACSALAAVNAAGDDKHTHWDVAFVVTPVWHPLRIQITLRDMASEAGWSTGRHAILWVPGSLNLIKMKVVAVEANSPRKEVRVVLQAFPWSHEPLKRLIHRFGRDVPGTRAFDVCVRLGKSTTSANPVYDIVSRMDVFDNVMPRTLADQLITILYANQPLGTSDEPHLKSLPPPSDEERFFRVKGRSVALTPDQRDAVRVGTGKIPLVAIQAAFGTGKTLVGAIIAALLSGDSETIVIVTTSTNAAVAQFTDTLLSLEDFPQMRVVRHISDTAAADNLTPTPVDLSKVLKSLGSEFKDQLSEEDLEKCELFKGYRDIIESYMEHPEAIPNMTDDQKDEYEIAEQYVSRTLKRMVKIMFRVRRPSVICMTTSSLLNSTGRKGIFKSYIRDFRVVIGDEASQIPEPALLSIASRLPHARQVYIGDVHQLAPHVKCPPTANPAVHGARSVMDLLLHAPAVPVAPLITTFRAHPALLALPNRIAYDGQLVSGTPAEARSLLVSRMFFPTPGVPFIFVDVAGKSAQAPSMSHFNENEISACLGVLRKLLRLGIAPQDICVITFYREQYRQMKPHAEQYNVELTTVDSVQGREKEVVLLLTTKTNFNPYAATFINDYRRLNVATTHCRHGHFVFGHAKSLRALPTWNTLLQWAYSLRAVVTQSQVLRYFEP
nr:regulator of nonsense transcripts [Haemonchus contortus]